MAPGTTLAPLPERLGYLAAAPPGWVLGWVSGMLGGVPVIAFRSRGGSTPGSSTASVGAASSITWGRTSTWRPTSPCRGGSQDHRDGRPLLGSSGGQGGEQQQQERHDALPPGRGDRMYEIN